jgi:DNA-binding CsgD family transcriptional regulator
VDVKDLPGPLRLTSRLPFVGRSAELETFRALLPTAEGEGRRIVLVGGEAGSGKSRVVREFAREAVQGGTLVLYGACDAVVRTPYGPFVEALDHLAHVLDPAELRAAAGTGGGELTRLLPDLALLMGDLPPPVKADPDTERHRLHTAVTDLFVGLSGRPVLLVVEDGHWADAPTLLLLRHLARTAGEARLLIVATFRDTEAEVPEGLAGALADLRRFEDVVRLRLGGLSEDDVSDFLHRVTGGGRDAGPPELAPAIAELTGGNPFLVCELWRALVETQRVEVVDGAIRLVQPLAELGTPQSVREVVNQRLSRLDGRTNQVLELFATAGAEFGLDLVRRAAGQSEPELLAAVDDAVRSGMIEELPSRRLAYRFTHELVRRALYDGLSGVRRAELHLRVGEALERPGERSGRALADLAYHFTAAAACDAAGRGVAYNVRAARAATAALAFDQAASLLVAARELGIEDPTERAGVLLELGTASHRAGKALDALQAFRVAAGIARMLGSGELLARAAIGYEDACWRPGITEQGAVELLEEAATLLGRESSELRVGLLGGLARALDFRGDHERGALVRTQAVEMARRLNDRTGLAATLVRSYWSRGTSSLEEILVMLTEATALGEDLANTEILAEAMAWRVPAFVAFGDLHSARREISALRATADQTAQPFMLHLAEQYGSAMALCDGRLQEAESRARRSHEWSRLLTGRDASGGYGIQMFSVRREQGRLAELAPVIRVLATDGKRAGPWRPGLVSVLVELGMTEEAGRELSRAVAEGLDPYRESLWLAALAYLTDACAALGDRAAAEILYPALEALSGANVMIGHLVASYGAADRYLGMLAATLGDWDRAEQHFDRALELNRHMGATTWVAHTAYEYARGLLRRGPGERDRARALISEAASLAEGIGLTALLGRTHALESPAHTVRRPDALSSREIEILRLVAQGLSNREIGSHLFISEHTAANHIRNILRKTDSANRTEATSYAHRHGFIDA